jgi:hypothetical protein
MIVLETVTHMNHTDIGRIILLHTERTDYFLPTEYTAGLS